MVKYFGLIFMMMMLVLSGCNTKSESLNNLNHEIIKYGINTSIPQIDDLIISYVHVVLPPKDMGKNNLGDVNTVVVSYTEEKGKLIKLRSDQKEKNDIIILYGPFEANSILNLSISNTENSIDGASIKTTHGKEMYYKKNNNNLILLANHKKMSFIIEGQITDKYTEERYVSIMDDILSSN
ncbi:hypothetical protein [Cohnella phaseoli]|uniref:DUF4367 domain-containing protein n=1 Tax=Cohnella phaseoli TaxID=456490 RepID=A0A3D9JQN4_9BACL|nr:hypothetical protein [Cohnella phaseoli]RED75746.1 hypothetical protein DFP98_114107 [Cohnella phaseoli]